VHDEVRSGRPSLVIDDLVRNVNERERDDRRFPICDLSLHFPQISRTLLVVIWVIGKWQAATFYEEGIQKLVPRYDKCLNYGGEYVEKYLNKGLKNAESDNNKTLYETSLDFLKVKRYLLSE